MTPDAPLHKIMTFFVFSDIHLVRHCRSDAQSDPSNISGWQYVTSDISAMEVYCDCLSVVKNNFFQFDMVRGGKQNLTASIYIGSTRFITPETCILPKKISISSRNYSNCTKNVQFDDLPTTTQKLSSCFLTCVTVKWMQSYLQVFTTIYLVPQS